MVATVSSQTSPAIHLISLTVFSLMLLALAHAGRLEKFAQEGFKTATFETFTPNSYDLIINMTSAGLEDDSLPAPKALLEKIIPAAKACVDVIYGKETPFLKLAKKHHKPTKDGSDMLLYQGIIAFEHFTGHRYTFADIRSYMKKAFIL